MESDELHEIRDYGIIETCKVRSRRTNGSMNFKWYWRASASCSVLKRRFDTPIERDGLEIVLGVISECVLLLLFDISQKIIYTKTDESIGEWATLNKPWHDSRIWVQLGAVRFSQMLYSNHGEDVLRAYVLPPAASIPPVTPLTLTPGSRPRYSHPCKLDFEVWTFSSSHAHPWFQARG